ncbi:MAG: carboxylesterase family protein, partial [Mycetocola sp.]
MSMTQAGPMVRVESGVLCGATHEGLHVFRGIPYAAPPFGANRFQQPVRPESWDGVRHATRSGVAAPQPATAPRDPWAPMYAPTNTGEDCLTLDVWTPELGATGLPVVVHIHGGGYMTGAGSLPLYSGRAFARDGIVHVSINYRLGIEGFLYLGDEHDSLGLRDQIAALEWVQRNIAAFGGNPDRV